jgi:hypothetical protein
MPAELSLARGCGNAALLDLAQSDSAGPVFVTFSERSAS